MVLLDRPTAGSGVVSRFVHWGGVGLYGAVAFVALFAETVAAGLGVDPLQVEAVLLSLLLFLGMNMAFSLLFEGATHDPQGPPDR